MKRLVVALALTLGLAVFSAPALSAQPLDPLNLDEFCLRDSNARNSSVCQSRNPSTNPLSGKDGVIVRAARLLSLAVGVASVFMIMVGGIKYVLSQGDSNNLTGARNMIIYSIVGLVVALTAQGIIAFVINRL